MPMPVSGESSTDPVTVPFDGPRGESSTDDSRRLHLQQAAAGESSTDYSGPTMVLHGAAVGETSTEAARTRQLRLAHEFGETSTEAVRARHMELSQAAAGESNVDDIMPRSISIGAVGESTTDGVMIVPPPYSITGEEEAREAALRAAQHHKEKQDSKSALQAEYMQMAAQQQRQRQQQQQQLLTGGFDSKLMHWSLNSTKLKPWQRFDMNELDVDDDTDDDDASAQGTAGINPPWVHSVSVSRDGELAAAGLGDYSVALFRLGAKRSTDRCAALLTRGHTHSVSQVLFTAAHRPTLVSGGNDARICLWDVQTSPVFSVAKGPMTTIHHGSKINWLACSPQLLFVADQTHDITAYPMTAGALSPDT
eukprot:m.356276 g.356276  ORF g.356276 m.356276 type:complete len:366 (-) comp19929_c8_seq2:69-1166(-)